MSSSLQPGSRLSHYHVLSPLGSGGMGEVYMAQDETLERAVALKILPAELMKSEERVRRFIQEAKSASSLSHPHIVTIYEIGKAEVRSAESGGEPHPETPAIHYIAMELISGETLKQKIHGEKADLKILLRFLSQAADGLAKAHSAGIIHRDLKPENIMITRDGYAKVLDFGLAKLTERAESGADPNTAMTATREQTREGAVMGTVAYMSPEQVQARPLDFRTDIFSFGSILYEAATRAKPFTADSDLEVMHKILRDKPAPVEEVNPDVPAELRRLIRRCLAKSPDQRFQSMKDLSIELGEIAEEYDELSIGSSSRVSGSGPSGSPLAAASPGGRGAKLALAAGILIGIAGLGFGIYAWLGRGAAGKAASERFDAMRMTRLTSIGKVEKAALSPDGKYLASVLRNAEGYSLWVKQVATGSDVQVAKPLPTPFVGVSFSPDGNYLYYVNQETGGPGYSILYQVPVLGGVARKLIFDIDTGVTFSPDGKMMAFIRGYPNLQEAVLMIANSDGSGEKKLVVRKNSDAFGVVRPSWSPDGKRLAVALANPRGGPHGEFETVDVATGKETPLGSTRWMPPFIAPMSFSWLPDGSGLVLTGREEKGARNSQVWFLSYPAGRARRITNDLNQYDGVSVTADSKTLATLQTNQAANLWVSPAGDLRDPRQITFGSGNEDAILDFSLAPDGVLFTGQKGDHTDIFSMSLDGTGPAPLTPDPSTQFAPRVQKDGKLVFFSSQQEDGVIHVWKMDREGGNRAQVTRGEGEILTSVSPDGRWAIFFTVTGSVWKTPTDGGEPLKLSDQSLGEGQVSPDGTRIALSLYISEGELLRRHIAILNAQDGKPAQKPILWPDGAGFRWSPAGDAIDYIKEANGVDNLWRQPLDGSAAKPITNFTSLELFSFAWTPGGDKLFLSRGQTNRDVVLITDFH